MTITVSSKTERSRPRLLSYRDLREVKGIKWSRQYIHEQVKLGKFPRPVNLGSATTDFVEHEIDQWLEDRIRARDAKAAQAAPAE
jgi:prophage regulatory protein